MPMRKTLKKVSTDPKDLHTYTTTHSGSLLLEPITPKDLHLALDEDSSPHQGP